MKHRREPKRIESVCEMAIQCTVAVKKKVVSTIELGPTKEWARINERNEAMGVIASIFPTRGTSWELLQPHT